MGLNEGDKMGKRTLIGGVSRGVLLVIVLSLAPMAAFADTLNWSISATSISAPGTLTYAGSSSPLIGTNIGVASVQDTTTGVSFNITNGLLNFTSGTGLGFWSWGAAPTGTLSLTGCINSVSLNVCGTLLSDDFTSAMISQPYGLPNYQVQLANITGTLNSALAGAFGVNGTVSSALYDTTVDVKGANFGLAILNGVTLGGTINSTAPAGPVTLPEPSSLTLLGFGLVAMAGTMAMHCKV
jgi:hypothetical protein